MSKWPSSGAVADDSMASSKTTVNGGSMTDDGECEEYSSQDKMGEQYRETKAVPSLPIYSRERALSLPARAHVGAVRPSIEAHVEVIPERRTQTFKPIPLNSVPTRLSVQGPTPCKHALGDNIQRYPTLGFCRLSLPAGPCLRAELIFVGR